MKARATALLAAALLAAGLYAPTLSHGFVFDDGPEVVDNEFLRSLEGLPRIFAHGAWEGAGEDNPIYRPLTTATFALNYAAGGLSPAGYHAVNVALHALAAALVAAVALLLGLSPWVAGLAGALFAAHPIRVEVVANVAGRKDELAAIFVLAALLAHARAVRRGGASLLAAPAALAAAMFSKEIGVAGLAVLAAWDFLYAGQSAPDPAERAGVRRRRIALYAAYCASIAAYLAARRAAVGSLGAPGTPFEENPLAFAGAGPRILTALGVVGRGIWLQLAPLKLSPDYSFDAIPVIRGALDPLVLASVAAVALCLALAFRYRRAFPVGLFGLVLYAATLGPASNLLFPVGTIFGERLLYLPGAALCLIAAALLPRPAAAVLVLALGARTLAYAPVWRDEQALFAAAVEAQPRSSKARRLYAGALMEHGEPEAAAAQLEEALRLVAGQPVNTSRPRVELGVAYEALGRGADAARIYQAVLRDDPAYADAAWRLGNVRWTQARRDEAVALWRRAVELDSRHARALSDLGIAAWSAGDLASAEAMWVRATRADPGLARVWERLGELYRRQGNAARARQSFEEFLRRAHGRFPDEERAIAASLRGDAATGATPQAPLPAPPR